jgi:hypothetical protein
MPKKKKKLLFLETQMDSDIGSSRSQIGYMKELIRNLADNNVEIITKEIHSKHDLEKFLEYARKDKTIEFIHIVCHGYSQNNSCVIYLTKNEEVNLKHKRVLELFKNLKDKVIFFSACQISANAEAMTDLLLVSKCQAIFGYTRDINDSQAIMIESIFYHYIFGLKKGYYFRTIYQKILHAIDNLDIDYVEEPLADPLLVYFE